MVGGGISGLAAAWRLTRGDDPPEVTVIEASAQVGGKLRLGRVGGLTVDVGAESVLARRPEAVALMRELDLEVVHPEPRSASIVTRGALHRMPAGTVMGVPADHAAVAALAGLLTGDELARAAHETITPPVEDDVDVASWVAGRVGRPVVDRLVEPLLGGVYAGHADELSLEATVPALWQRAVRGEALIGEHRTVNAGPGPVFAGLRGGVGRLPLVLSERLRQAGVTVTTGTTVRELTRTGSGWRLETGPAPRPAFVEADEVVLAVPPAAAAKLLARESPLASSRLGGVRAASVVVIAAAVPRAQWAGIEGSGLLVPPVEGTAVKAATFSSAKWAWVSEDSDLVVVRLSLGRAGEEHTLQRDDAELTDRALADLRAMLGRPVEPVDTLVQRWGGALPQYTVGHRERIEGVRAAVGKLPGLTVCGAVFDGVGIPACIAAADRAVRDLFGKRENGES